MKGVFCTREVTEGLDRGPESIYQKLKELLPENRIICLKQVHSDTIVKAEDVRPDDFPEADGVISLDPSIVLCIRTADCVPVLIWAEDSPVIAAIHAGWRGLAKGIVSKAIKLIQEIASVDLHVAMGPYIGPCCYAVGEDVIKALDPKENCYTTKGKPSVDLHRTASRQAQEVGVAPEKIHRVNLCTCCNNSTFSYRREGEHTGRNISLIGGNACSLPGLQAQ